MTESGSYTLLAIKRHSQREIQGAKFPLQEETKDGGTDETRVAAHLEAPRQALPLCPHAPRLLRAPELWTWGNHMLSVLSVLGKPLFEMCCFHMGIAQAALDPPP